VKPRKTRRKPTLLVLRGCVVRVPLERAAALREEERRLAAHDWNTNQLD